MQFRSTILSLFTIVMSSTLAAQAAHTSNPSTLSTDSVAQRVALLYEKANDLSKVVTWSWSESKVFQSVAEIGLLHQIMNDLLKEQGWSFEEAMSLQGQNGKKADRIHQGQANGLQRLAPRKWRKASGRETVLECCVVLSLYHEFQTSDGDHRQERIALKGTEHERAQLDVEQQKKNRRRKVAGFGASVVMVGVAIVGLPIILLIFGGGFVS